MTAIGILGHLLPSYNPTLPHRNAYHLIALDLNTTSCSPSIPNPIIVTACSPLPDWMGFGTDRIHCSIYTPSSLWPVVLFYLDWTGEVRVCMILGNGRER